LNESTKTEVRERAKYTCEYCQVKQVDSPLAALQIEHVIPKKHGGGDESANLGLACIDCNLHKGPNLTGIDPDSGEITPLFNPREQDWSKHFKWEGVEIVGLTACGRTTVVVLDMNSEYQLDLRIS
jgi:5-methylcytosine-specific restriction endonuclease McrA